MPKIITFRRSMQIILPFTRGGIERRHLGMAPRKIYLQPFDDSTQELLRRPRAVLFLGSFMVAPAIENDLLVRLSVGGTPRSNGLVSAALLKKFDPGLVRSEKPEDVVLEVEAEKDLMLDCALLALVSWNID